VPGAAYSRAWNLHSTAVRMGRADYCYDGNSQTIDGTEIVFFVDPAQYPMIPEPVMAPLVPDATYFEAGWMLDTTAEDEHALCLSKLRWQTLPPGNLCNGLLLDPRVDQDGLYCEDYGVATGEGTPSSELFAAGAVLINESEINDLGLYRWQNNGEHVSTTRGYVDDVSLATQPSPPRPGYTYVRREANTLSTDGRDVFAAEYGGVYLPLRTYSRAGELVTTIPGLVPAGYSFVQDEGFIFATAPAVLPDGMASAPLYRYKRSVGAAEFLTTTRATAPTGYGSRTLLGHALVREPI
jgi:hypothetical protein